MADLARWIDENFDALVDAAAQKLSQRESLKTQVSEAVEAFFDGILRTIRTSSQMPINAILIDWLEARSAPTAEEPLGLLQVIITLKQAMWEQIQQRCSRDEAIQLIVTSDNIFNQAIAYMAKLEADALLVDSQSELRRAQLRLEKLDKNKSDFIGVASHELKTPLTLIEGYANMMNSDSSITGDADSRASLMLRGIMGGTKRLREIIEDMIDVSLIDLNLLQLHYQPVWLHRLLDILESDFREVGKQRNLQLVIQRDSVPNQPTYGDPERLFQVLSKVLANAIKYTPDGGSIIVSGRDLPGFADIMIIDRGIGISAANLLRIFDTFSSLGDLSLHSSGKTKFKGGGPGLGLSIAKGILEAHGGTIWAQSPGYDEVKLPGSTFHIMVPMRSAPPDDTMAALFKPKNTS